jgi:hypothetical protein
METGTNLSDNSSTVGKKCPLLKRLRRERTTIVAKNRLSTCSRPDCAPLRAVLILIASVVLLSTNASTTPLPWRTEVHGAEAITTAVTLHSEKARQPAGSAITPRRLATRVRGLGRMTLDIKRLTTRYWPATIFDDVGRPVTDPTDVALLQGTATLRGGGSTEISVPVALTRYSLNGKKRTIINLVLANRLERKRAVELRSQDSTTLFRVRSVPTALLAARSCGAGDSSHAVSAPLAGRASAATEPDSAPTTLRALGIGAASDTLWRSRFGAAANAEIAAIINAADTIYRAQLGLTFVIEGVNDIALALSTNAETALDDFRLLANSNLSDPDYDVTALFSTRDFNDNVVGIAYVGVICRFPDFAHSITIDLGPLTSLVFAHETGHNLNANHTSPCDDSIMCASIGASNTAFSTPSITTMNQFIATHGACLTTTTAPTPTPPPFTSPTPTPTQGPTPTPTSTPTPAPNGGDMGSDPIPTLPNPLLSAALTKSGRLTINLALSGPLTEGSTYRLFLSDNSSFTGFVYVGPFEPRPDGTARFTAFTDRGVKTKRDKRGRLIKQKMWVMIAIQNGPAIRVAVRSVDPTKVSPRRLKLRNWIARAAANIAPE